MCTHERKHPIINTDKKKYNNNNNNKNLSVDFPGTWVTFSGEDVTLVLQNRHSMASSRANYAFYDALFMVRL